MHAFGGFAALAMIVLGPRAGKYVDGEIKPILGHSMPLATIGVFLLWLGWFGFNGGSVLGADPGLVSIVFDDDEFGCSRWLLSPPLVTSQIFLKKPDVTMALNVQPTPSGITAGQTVTWTGAMIIGLVAGIIVVFSIVIIDRIKIDDPVGAISVHGICGIWGTIAVGIFGTNPEHSFSTQLIGTLSLRCICLCCIAYPGILFSQGHTRLPRRRGRGVRGIGLERTRSAGLRRLPEHQQLSALRQGEIAMFKIEAYLRPSALEGVQKA